MQVQFCPTNLARCIIRAREFFVCAIPWCHPVCVDVVVSALFICTVHSLTILFFTTSNRSQEFPLRTWPRSYNGIVTRTRAAKQGAGTGSHNKLFSLLVGFRVFLSTDFSMLWYSGCICVCLGFAVLSLPQFCRDIIGCHCAVLLCIY